MTWPASSAPVCSKPVISNAVEVTVAGDAVTVTNEIFGGAQLVDTIFRAGPPYLVVAAPEIVRGGAGRWWQPRK